MGNYLLFGGAGGIGSAIASELHKNGHQLFLTGRDEAKLEAMADQVDGTYGVCDVCDKESVNQIVKQAADQMNGIDGLVYAVGTINLSPAGKLDTETALQDYKINALGAFLAVQAALPFLKKAEQASVLLFSTVAVRQGFAAHSSIAMAKGAVEGLVKALAAELSPKIRVNAIAPTLTDTPLAEPMTKSEAMLEAISDMHALKRIGKPEDIAPLAALLLTDAGRYITGQIFGVDGGRSTLRPKG